MANAFLKLILFGLFTCLMGCGSSKLNPLSNDDVILAFGDSLTVGVGTSEENSYPRLLATLSGFEVIGSGVSGETTEEGLVRLPDVLEEHQPALLILLEGGNDILRNKNANQTKANLDHMIQLAQQWGVQVVLIGVPEKNLFSSSAPFYRELAEKYDLVFEPNLVGSLIRSPTMKSDSVHFNKQGYAALAEGIYDLLEENGAF